VKFAYFEKVSRLSILAEEILYRCLLKEATLAQEDTTTANRTRRRKKMRGAVAFATPIEVSLARPPKVSSVVGVRCRHCQSVNTTRLILPNGTEIHVCRDCHRRFAPRKGTWKKLSSAEKTRILDLYVTGGRKSSVRAIATELGTSHMKVQHVLDNFAMRCKSPLDRAEELHLRPSPYLEVDKTMLAISGQWHYALVIADAMAFFIYVYELLEKPLNAKEEEESWLTQVTKMHLEAVKTRLNWKPVLAITDDDKSQIAAIREAYGPRVAVQFCVWHVLNYMDNLMPTKRNPKVPALRRLLWRRFKRKIRAMLLAPTREEFDWRFKQVLSDEWQRDTQMNKAIQYLTEKYEMLVAHFKFPGSPRTTGAIERIIQTIKWWVREKRGFKNPSLARKKLHLKVNYVNHTRFTSSETGLNGKSPAQLSGAPTNSNWLQCIEREFSND